MKSIKMKILSITIAVILVSMTTLLISGSLSTYSSTLTALEKSMNVAVDNASKIVQSQVNHYKALAIEFSFDETLTQYVAAGNETARTAVLNYASASAERQGLQFVKVTNSKGIDLDTGLDLSERDYYIEAKDTRVAVLSDPLARLDTGDLEIMVATPITKSGIFFGMIVIGIDPNIFCDLVAAMTVGEESDSKIINKDGYTIAYKDVEYVKNNYHCGQEAETDSKIKKIAEIESKLIQGERGFDTYYWNGIDGFVAYAPIPDTTLGVYITANKSEFVSNIYSSILVNVALGVVIMIIAAVIVLIFAKKISKPITLCADRLSLLAKGDLKSPVPQISSNDETKILASSTKEITDTLSFIIDNINDELREIGNGNFNLENNNSNEYYFGDFKPIPAAILQIRASLSDTLSNINISSDQVNAGADQVSMGSQSLAQGSTQQAASVKELADTIEIVSKKIEATAKDSQIAKEATESASKSLTKSNEYMEDMVNAMNDIIVKSKEIGNIIKVIDDIAFQTNILALNAAVEAARAGVAGRGFSVVADEVKNLASKSAKSAKDTEALIQDTIKVVKHGGEIASKTSSTIEEVFEKSKELTKIVDKIALASEEEAKAVKEITDGVEEIADVIQDNSATAEKSAAASEQLSGQAHILKDLVSHFKLMSEDFSDFKFDFGDNDDLDNSSDVLSENQEDFDFSEGMEENIEVDEVETFDDIQEIIEDEKKIPIEILMKSVFDDIPTNVEEPKDIYLGDDIDDKY